MTKHTPKRIFVKSAIVMDTIVTIKVVTDQLEFDPDEKLSNALEVFYFVERVCSRFDPESEISRLSSKVGISVPVSEMLFETLKFALEVAEFTEGIFDPTVGNILNSYGFNQNYLTGIKTVSTPAADSLTSYRDVELDEVKRTVLLHKPVVLDLGATAKGLAIDLASRELSQFEGFFIDAGGDICVGGFNEFEKPWIIGIRHPRQNQEIIDSLQLSNASVCTSGSYERVSPVKSTGHHLIDPRSGISPTDVLSCTVIAPFAMLADAFSTAAFILGREKGLALLEEAGLDGMLITSSLEKVMTEEMRRYIL